MRNTGAMTKLLAIAGTVLVWAPFAFLAWTSISRSIALGRVRFDYLMIAELFPIAAVGALLLLGAAWIARDRRGPIGWGLFTAVVGIAGGSGIAVLSGLASGETNPTDSPVWWALTLALIVGVTTIALIEVGVEGIALIRDLYTHGHGTSGSNIAAPTG